MLKSIICSLVLISLFGLSLRESRAQSNEKKFEVGGQFSALHVPTQTATVSGAVIVLNENRDNNYGFGGRFGYNFSKYFALEAEGNFFPRNRDLDGGRKIQGLIGVKAGKQFEKVGVFAKARPGFVRYEKGDYIFVGGPAVFPPLLSSFRPVARTNFAFDLGGVIELYPSRRTIIRFDAGDTIVHLPARNVAAFQINAPSPGFSLVVVPASAQTTHNLQVSVGLGYRF